MKTPNIDSLLSLVDEINHLKEAKELLWEAFMYLEGGKDSDYMALRYKLTKYLNINEDE